MATRSDLMLIQALTQLGAGAGSFMNRRRDEKRKREEAASLFPSGMQAPEVQVQPEGNALISAMLGGMPGGAGMANMMTSAQQAGAQGQLDRRVGAANQQAEQLQKMYASRDPMLRQIAGSALAQKFGPKKERKISDLAMSVADGIMIMDPGTGKLNFKKTKETEKKTKTLRPGDVIYDPDSGRVVFKVPDTDMKSWLSQESKMGQDGIPVERQVVIFEDGTKIPATDYGPSTRSFGITSPVMGSGEKAKWREKIEDTKRSLREFSEIREMFNPDFLTIMGKARSGASEIMSRFNVLDSFPGEKERYTDKTEFFTAVSDRANRYIKDITGAQMSEAEATRLLKAIPNVEDDPAAFSSKLDRVIQVSQAALDQYEEILWQTQSQDAAKAAADRVVREMMMQDETPSFVGEGR